MFGLADAADTRAEQEREMQARGRMATPSSGDAEDARSALLRWLRQQRDYGIVSEDEYAAKVAAAKHGGMP